MIRGQTVKYMPQQRQAPGYRPYLYPVPTPPSQGVGAEASGLALAMEKLADRINMTETLTRALLSRLEEHAVPLTYNHVDAKLVGSMKVRFRNVGRLSAREVPIDDE